MATTTPIGSLVVKAQRSVLAGGQAHRDLATREGAQLVGGVQHAIDRAADLHEGIAERLAALARDLLGEVVASAFHQSREPAQDGDALVRLQPAVAIAEGPRGGLQLRFERVRIVGRDLGDRRAVKACTICSMVRSSGLKLAQVPGTRFLSSSMSTRVFSE